MKLLTTLAASAGLLMAASVASAAPIYADGVVVDVIGGGAQNPAKPDRADPLESLGAPDGVFYSLGFGGEATYTFEGGSTYNATGTTIYEVTYGTIANFVEIVDVYAVLLGVETYVGTILNDGAQQSQGGSSVFVAQMFDAIRLKDVSPFVVGKDGFDVDAISIDAATVPLPAAGLLLLGGIAGLGLVRRKA